MAITLAQKVRWGNSPTNYFDFSYEKVRSGADMRYKITVVCEPCYGESYFGFPIYLEIKLGGSTVTKTLKNASPSRWTENLTYTTDWMTAANMTSGTASLTIRIYSGSGSSRNTSYGYRLAVDPAASSVSATDAYIGSASTITINRYSSGFTHTVSYKAEGESGYTTIFEKRGLTSYGWVVPTEFYALTVWRRWIDVEIKCDTYDGDELVGSSFHTMAATVKESENAPDVTVCAEDTKAAATLLTGSNKRIISGYNALLVSSSGTAKNGAIIQQTRLAVGSVTKDGASATFDGAESDSISATVGDSRGFSTTAKVTDVTLVPYIELTCTPTVTRESPTSNSVTITVKGNFFGGSFGAKENTLSVSAQAKRTGEDVYGELTELAVTIDGNGYTATGTLSGVDYRYTHNVRVIAEDLVHRTGGALADEVASVSTVGKGIPVFDWGENDFAFHVPVSIDGCGSFPGDGWQTLTPESNFDAYNAADPPVYRKVGALVQIVGSISPHQAISGSETEYKIAALPEGYRPKTAVGVVCQGGGSAAWLLLAKPDGEMTFSRYRDKNGLKTAETSERLYFNAVFFCA